MLRWKSSLKPPGGSATPLQTRTVTFSASDATTFTIDSDSGQEIWTDDKLNQASVGNGLRFWNGSEAGNSGATYDSGTNRWSFSSASDSATWWGNYWVRVKQDPGTGTYSDWINLTDANGDILVSAQAAYNNIGDVVTNYSGPGTWTTHAAGFKYQVEIYSDSNRPDTSTYVYEEDFEGSGTPSGFTNTIVGSGTIDYDYTTDPGSGSESLEVVTSGGDSFAELDFGAIYDNFELIFQNKIASGGSNRTWIVLSDDSNYTSPDHIVIGNVSGWDYGFNHNFNAVTRSTTGVGLGSWHWAKLNVDIPNNTITLTISASSDFSSADVATTTSQTFGSSFGGVRYARFGGRNRDMTVLVDSITLEDLSPTYILEERFEESDSGGALGSSTDGYDSSLVSSEVTTTGSTIDPDESTTSVLSGSQSLEIDSASGDNYVEFDLGADYDELWFHVEANRLYSTTSNRSIIKFFNQSGTIAADLRGNSSNKPTVIGASATTSFTYANTSAVDHFWLHWVRNSTSTFYFGANTSTRPTSGGDVVSFTAADVAIGKFQIGIFGRSGNYRYDDIIVSTSAIGDDP
ncbi:MAG: hypothetical protein VXB01_10935 [Opitutae bacterium]